MYEIEGARRGERGGGGGEREREGERESERERERWERERERFMSDSSTSSQTMLQTLPLHVDLCCRTQLRVAAPGEFLE